MINVGLFPDNEDMAPETKDQVLVQEKGEQVINHLGQQMLFMVQICLFLKHQSLLGYVNHQVLTQQQVRWFLYSQTDFYKTWIKLPSTIWSSKHWLLFPIIGRRLESLEQRVNGHDQANRTLLEQIMKLTQDMKVRI